MDEYERRMYEEFDEEDEDMGPLEKEVEQIEVHFRDTNLALKIFLQDDDDEFESWMSTIHVDCSYEGKVIGTGLGRYVKRDWIRPNFWRDMEEPCQELSSIAFEVFDRYGRLLPDFKDHPVRKGSGVWGSELDRGSLFIVE